MDDLRKSWQSYDEGKAWQQTKVLILMDQVIRLYESYDLDDGRDDHDETQAQLIAVKFMKNWVLSGGKEHEDEDGNWVCCR